MLGLLTVLARLPMSTNEEEEEEEEEEQQQQQQQQPIPREDDLREGFRVPHDTFLKSINSFAPCCELFLPPSDRGCNITLLELTNQVALLK